jgi:hypothetical protein
LSRDQVVQRIADRLLLQIPLCRPAMENRHVFGVHLLEHAAERLCEQQMVAVPARTPIDGNQEQVGLLDPGQYLLPVGQPCQNLAE